MKMPPSQVKSSMNLSHLLSNWVQSIWAMLKDHRIDQLLSLKPAGSNLVMVFGIWFIRKSNVQAVNTLQFLTCLGFSST